MLGSTNEYTAVQLEWSKWKGGPLLLLGAGEFDSLGKKIYVILVHIFQFYYSTACNSYSCTDLSELGRLGVVLALCLVLLLFLLLCLFVRRKDVAL